MSKGLEALAMFIDDIEGCVNSGGIHYIDTRNKDIIQKELKALEIIKKKRVWVDALINMTYKEYNDYCQYVWVIPNITQEEYKLLKEVLL